MPTYKPSTNIDPTKALYGEKSTGVLALQKQLNAQGAGLKEDSLYGPLTQAAFQKYNTPTPPLVSDTSKTIGSTFQVPTIQGQSQQELDYLAMQDKLSRGEDIVDTSAIRSKTLADFQDRINAINQVYAGKLSEAKQQGVGRVGQTTSILANRGLTGSIRGGTIGEQTLSQNKQIEDAINQEKSLALASIFNDIDSTVTAEATRRREAMQSGAKNYIEFIKGQDTRKQTNISNVAGALLAQGIDPSTMTPQELNDIANKLGATSGDIISAYKKAKTEESINLAKEMPKDTSSIQEYKYAVSQGYNGTYNEYQNEDANRKKAIAKAGVGGLTPYQQFQATQSIAKDTQSRTESAREMARQANLIDSSYNSILKGGDRSLNTQAIITSFNKILDPTSVVRESEYDRTAAGQSLIKQLEGKVQNIVSGGAGVTESTLKEASVIAKKYLEGARASIDAQNKRAEAMAAQFGLNPDFVTSTNFATGTTDGNGTALEPDPLGLGI